MIEIEKPRIDCEQLAEDGSYGKFVVEPLERGYGTVSYTHLTLPTTSRV